MTQSTPTADDVERVKKALSETNVHRSFDPAFAQPLSTILAGEIVERLAIAAAADHIERGEHRTIASPPKESTDAS